MSIVEDNRWGQYAKWAVEVITKVNIEGCIATKSLITEIYEIKFFTFSIKVFKFIFINFI